MITRDDALEHRNEHFYHSHERTRDGSSMRVRRSGMTKTWKRRPSDFHMPVKYGLYNSSYISERNQHEWHLFDRGAYEKLAGVKTGTPLEILHDKLSENGHEAHAKDVMDELKKTK
jgi:hypothetical protein